ncbi:MAG: membrane dipeptidase [Acidobacteria bacterium]|nr:membrane dipeptidase [Acidobacteriota bacterium]
MMHRILSGFVWLIILRCPPGEAQPATDAAARARELHFSSLVLDTHVDTTSKLLSTWSFVEEHASGHVDLPRLKKGGLNALFFSIYVPGTVTGPEAVTKALERIAAVHKLIEDLPGEMALCMRTSEVRAARRQGKIAALIGMEGGHMISNSLPILRDYALLGVRYLTLTHSVNTDWADSSGDRPRHNGLTDFGRDVVRELNRLGVMVDVSHVSDKTFWDVLEVSRAPVIASHSSCRALADNPRNMTDAMMRAVAEKGGVVQINFHRGFLDNAASEYERRAGPMLRELLSREPETRDYQAAFQEIRRRIGSPPAVSWERIIDHIDHAVKVAGIDHVGLGSDFDGAQMPEGMGDCAQLPRITEALLGKGYSDSDVRRILGENTLRLMTEVEQTAMRLRDQKSAATGK